MIELSFPLRGTPLPYDHGYLMCRAVAGIVPWVAEPAQTDLAIVPIHGSPHGGFLHLTSVSRLAFRLNADDVEKLLPLSDQSLVIEAAALKLGRPTESRLRPVPGLASPFVAAEHHRHSDEVLEWLKAEFRALDIRAVPTLRLKHGREGASPAEQSRRSFDCPYARHHRQIGENAVIGWEVFQYWDPDRIETIYLKPEEIPRIGYIPVAVSRYTQDRAAAQMFIDCLLSPEGKAPFRKYHYLMDPQEARRFARPATPIGGEYSLPNDWRGEGWRGPKK